MAEAKTKPTGASVDDFIAAVADPERREDCRTLVQIMEQITGAKPQMWGPSIVGFGTYTYVYATGRSGDWPLTAFSPRKAALTLYIMCGFAAQSELMDKLGPHKTGKCCLYVKRLSDIHLPTLKKLIVLGAKEPCGLAEMQTQAKAARKTASAKNSATPKPAAKKKSAKAKRS